MPPVVSPTQPEATSKGALRKCSYAGSLLEKRSVQGREGLHVRQIINQSPFQDVDQTFLYQVEIYLKGVLLRKMKS